MTYAVGENTNRRRIRDILFHICNINGTNFIDKMLISTSSIEAVMFENSKPNIYEVENIKKNKI